MRKIPAHLSVSLHSAKTYLLEALSVSFAQPVVLFCQSLLRHLVEVLFEFLCSSRLGFSHFSECLLQRSLCLSGVVLSQPHFSLSCVLAPLGLQALLPFFCAWKQKKGADFFNVRQNVLSCFRSTSKMSLEIMQIKLLVENDVNFVSFLWFSPRFEHPQSHHHIRQNEFVSLFQKPLLWQAAFTLRYCFSFTKLQNNIWPTFCYSLLLGHLAVNCKHLVTHCCSLVKQIRFQSVVCLNERMRSIVIKVTTQQCKLDDLLSAVQGPSRNFHCASHRLSHSTPQHFVNYPIHTHMIILLSK